MTSPVSCQEGTAAHSLSSSPIPIAAPLLLLILQIAGAVLTVLSVTIYAAHRWYVSRQAARAPTGGSSSGGSQQAADGGGPMSQGV